MGFYFRVYIWCSPTVLGQKILSREPGASGFRRTARKAQLLREAAQAARHGRGGSAKPAVPSVSMDLRTTRCASESLCVCAGHHSARGLTLLKLGLRGAAPWRFRCPRAQAREDLRVRRKSTVAKHIQCNMPVPNLKSIGARKHEPSFRKALPNSPCTCELSPRRCRSV